MPVLGQDYGERSRQNYTLALFVQGSITLLCSLFLSITIDKDCVIFISTTVIYIKVDRGYEYSTVFPVSRGTQPNLHISQPPCR